MVKTKLMNSNNEEASNDPAKAADAVSKKYHHEALVSLDCLFGVPSC